jgi:lysyl-tRNA synthetase, class II
MSRLDDTINAKKEKRASLEKLGVTIHPYSFDKKQSVVQCREMEGQQVKTAGRIMSWRTHGKVVFLDLQDNTGKIQVLLHKDNLGDKFAQLSFIDMGDFLGVEGEVSTTKTGEITIKATAFEFHGKALRPLPTAWNASEDKEVRFRKRYIDLLVNPEAKRVLDARWLILKETRRYLEDVHDFIEVETPVLQPLYGGTNATPFTTYMKALDTDFYLRLAPELYLKRLVTGGYERIFEIARNFRNEGIDQTHQPEFTMIEWYHAYADYHVMMNTAEGLIRHLVQKLNGSTKLQVQDTEVDLAGKWPRITMFEALIKHMDIDFENLSDAEVQALMTENKIEVIGEFTRGKAMFALFDKLVTPYLIEPTWIIDYPRDVSPLSKRHRNNPNLAERFEGYIGGKELADGWSEIVDPVDQRNIFENEQKRMRSGDDEAHPMDEDFIESMEHGLPPLGGIGMGMDRLVMFLTNTWSIKEVIAFPTLRPIRDHEIEPIVRKSGGDESSGSLPARDQSQALVDKYIKNDKLSHHCLMVAQAMEAYAKVLGEDEELWYQTGLLHDLDWEMYPDEHPNRAVDEILADYPSEMLAAIKAHAPAITGQQPESLLDKYLFACDELSGLMHAASLMRPGGFEGMKAKSVKKKMKAKAFAANVSRDDIRRGFELIGKEPNEHIEFLIGVFQ